MKDGVTMPCLQIPYNKGLLEMDKVIEILFQNQNMNCRLYMVAMSTWTLPMCFCLSYVNESLYFLFSHTTARGFSFLDLALFRAQSGNIKLSKRCAIAVRSRISNGEIQRSTSRCTKPTFSKLHFGNLSAKRRRSRLRPETSMEYELFMKR